MVKSKSNEIFIKKDTENERCQMSSNNLSKTCKKKINFTQEAAYINNNSNIIGGIKNISNCIINHNNPNKNYSDYFYRNNLKNNAASEKIPTKNSSNSNILNTLTLQEVNKSNVLLETIKEFYKDSNSYANKFNYNNMFKERENSLNAKNIKK